MLAQDNDVRHRSSDADKGDTVKRTLFSLTLFFGLLLSPVSGVVAQPVAGEQTYTSEITGDEIDLGSSGEISWIPENFDFRQTVSFQEEYIWFTYNWSNFEIVLIDGPNEAATYHETTLGNMEQFYDSWELIDQEITEEHSWFLGNGEISGSPLVVYYEFEMDALGDVDLVFMQFTDITTLQSDLEFVQSEVTIAGAPVLPETDASALAMIAGAESTTPESSPEAEEEGQTSSRTSRGGTDSTEEATAESEESTSSRSRTSRGGTDASTVTDDGTDATAEPETDRESRVGRLGDTLTTGEPENESEVDTTPVSGANWDTMGLVSDGEWVSPTYGNDVSWDTSIWEFPEDFEYAIIVNDDPPYDILTLQTTDGLGYVYITVDDAYESTPRSLVDYWVTPEYSQQITNGVTVLETGTTRNSATMVYETTNSIDQPLLVVLEATFLEDGRVIFSQISGAPDTIHEVYGQYVEGVLVDGEPLEMTFTIEDIQDISGN